MPRKGPVRKRQIIPDPVYNSVMAQRFINRLQLDGKKSVAEHIFYGALQIIEEKGNRPGLEVFEQAIKNPAVVERFRGHYRMVKAALKSAPARGASVPAQAIRRAP